MSPESVEASSPRIVVARGARAAEARLLAQHCRFAPVPVRLNGKDDGRYVLLDSPHRFILKAANGVEIAESAETYGSAAEAEAAITSTRALLSSERVANPW
ncbi:MAG: DUF1508 domain-containing protein [Myxococcota bacterium]